MGLGGRNYALVTVHCICFEKLFRSLHALLVSHYYDLSSSLLCVCFEHSVILFGFRHEKVQENCIDLVGRIADRGAEHVPAREWMRICFELLELLKAHKKAIRRATVNTFGYIAKAIG